MNTLAVVLEEPERLVLRRLDLSPPGDEDVVVDIEWSGISTGTERLLWSGRMPPFPGMGYPLVPGYESVGRVSAVGAVESGARWRARVRAGRALLRRRARTVRRRRRRRRRPRRARRAHRRATGRAGRAARAGGDRVSCARRGRRHQPDLIVGHGVLGRLLARLAVLAGGAPPVVWERNPRARGRRRRLRGRRPGRRHAPRLPRDLRRQRRRLPARHADRAPGARRRDRARRFLQRCRCRSRFRRRSCARRASASPRSGSRADLVAVRDLAESGRLSLDGLITHRSEARRCAPRRIARRSAIPPV